MFSGVAMGGSDGGAPPRAALLEGGKIEGIAKKNWEGEKHLGRRNLWESF